MARITAELEPFFQAQLAENTPPALQTLQQYYVNWYALLTTMWETVLSGRQTADQARHTLDVTLALLQHEQARLDIECPN